MNPNEPDPARGAAAGASPSDVTGNPYYVGAGTAPDLDAAAPSLRRAELQRLNRRALWFLAGILLLLVAGAVWLIRTATGPDGPPPAPRSQQVAIPELPRAAAPAAPLVVLPPAGPAEQELALPVLPSTSTDNTPALALPSSTASQPSLRERRIADPGSAQGATGAARDPYVEAMMAGLPGQAPPAQAVAAAPAGGARALRNADALLVRGTYLRCVLETRIVTDIPGFTSCIVTEPVYSINGGRLLLPRGSKVLGRYEREPTGPRVGVVWDRITTPDGIDVSMSSPGVDNLGGAGHPGHYSAHWGSRIASALLVSLISDAFKYVAAEEGPPTTTVGAGGVVVQNPYESTTARTIERLAHQALDARRPPTVTIHQGTVVNVYVARDVDFSAVLPR